MLITDKKIRKKIKSHTVHVEKIYTSLSCIYDIVQCSILLYIQ